MKKYFIIFLFLALFFSGCSNNNKINLSFEETKNIFTQDIKLLQKSIHLFGFSGFKDIDVYLNIHGENQDFKLKTNLDISGSIDYKNYDILSNSYIDFDFWDKSEQQNSLISGNLYYTLLDNYAYYKVDNLNIEIGKGNFQGELIGIILENIKQKWIRLDKKNVFFTHEIYKNLDNVLYIFSDTNTFQKKEKITYEGNLSYKFLLSPKSLDLLNENKFYKIQKFEGLFIINSKSEIILKIEEMLIQLDNEKYNIKGNIGSKNTEIKIQNQKYPEKIKKIKFSFNKKNIEISYSDLINMKEMFKLYLKLYPQNTTNNQKIQINGFFSISPIVVYGSDLEKDIEIDINGQYSFKNIEKINISEPESYVLGEQMLGDSFSLQTMMNSIEN